MFLADVVGPSGVRDDQLRDPSDQSVLLPCGPARRTI